MDPMSGETVFAGADILTQGSPSVQAATRTAAMGMPSSLRSGKQVLRQLMQTYFKGGPGDSPELVGQKAKWYIDLNTRLESLPELSSIEAADLFNDWVMESMTPIYAERERQRQDILDKAYAPLEQYEDPTMADVDREDLLMSAAFGLVHRMKGGSVGEALRFAKLPLDAKRESAKAAHEAKGQNENLKRQKLLAQLKGMDAQDERSHDYQLEQMRNATGILKESMGNEAQTKKVVTQMIGAMLRSPDSGTQTAAAQMWNEMFPNEPLPAGAVQALEAQSVSEREGETRIDKMRFQIDEGIAKLGPELAALQQKFEIGEINKGILGTKAFLLEVYGEKAELGKLAESEARAASLKMRAQAAIINATRPRSTGRGGGGGAKAAAKPAGNLKDIRSALNTRLDNLRQDLGKLEDIAKESEKLAMLANVTGTKGAKEHADRARDVRARIKAIEKEYEEVSRLEGQATKAMTTAAPPAKK